MQKWEYKVISFSPVEKGKKPWEPMKGSLEPMLNEYGDSGWENYAIAPNGDLFFKRSKPRSRRTKPS